ncbi:DUF5004 domain-containing protein [Robertkochia solimangrovi]|uniref:DUF5004 domain-containing protein n=1 Tax=Robertkochia solimangrovi TaxID=2213046 RepID=UPI0013A555CA|nr:DUF5004 domain-containing protein [Robertkochia solimangrovi]
MNFFRTSAITCMAIFALGCNNDDTNECDQNFTGALQTEEQDLVGEWRLTSATAEDEIDLTDDGEENPTTDLFIQFEECQRDIAYNFESDRDFTYLIGYNNTECESSRDGIAGTWKYEAGVLSIRSGCSFGNMVITLNDSDTAFTISEVNRIRDVQNVVVETTITYTYTRY